MSKFEENENKPRCYACEQELSSFAMLICDECLDTECERFETLASGKPRQAKSKRRR